MKSTNQPAVGPIDRATFGEPQSCQKCGGRLAPMFGQTIDDDGRRRPVIDPTKAQCIDCRTTFEMRDE